MSLSPSFALERYSGGETRAFTSVPHCPTKLSHIRFWENGNPMEKQSESAISEIAFVSFRARHFFLKISDFRFSGLKPRRSPRA